jgi:cellulose synthase/poly-beta-1,6-N-acetylglucosamine synthase-like glycosyltransferase
VLLGPHRPAVSIVMVVRNEENFLRKKLINLLDLEYPARMFELVVVSDGSEDATESILRECGDPRVRIVLKQLAVGKAAGLNDAVEIAEGELLMFTDVRQSIEPCALRMLVENFSDPDVGCVSGELMLGDAETGESAGGLSLYWRVEKRIREMESASGSVVGATGALYAIRRELFVPVPEGTVLDDVYIPMQVVKQGRRVVFEPRARAWDIDLGTEREFARKARTLNGNYQILQLAPWLLTSENPIRFEFVSHKLLRLTVPFALLVAFVTSALAHGVAYRAAWLMQVAFYGISLLALLRLGSGWLARTANAALTFVLLNTAALVAFANFVSRRKTGWSR